MPKVSVCIPTYNSARFLGAAIDSVLAQSYKDYELIVCDNASTDTTPELCATYGASLRYVRYERLVTQGGNWNRCLSLAGGDFVALLHADDEYKPSFLAERVAVLESDPDIGLAFGAVEIIDTAGAAVGVQRFRDEDAVFTAPKFFGELLMGCVISPVSPVVRSGCYREAGGFDESRLWGIDWEMWLRVSARHDVMYSANVCARYRVHGESGSGLSTGSSRRTREDLQVLRAALQRTEDEVDLRQFLPLRRRALHKAALTALYTAGASAASGNRRGVLASLTGALSADPSLVRKPTVWMLALSVVLGASPYRMWRTLRDRRRVLNSN